MFETLALLALLGGFLCLCRLWAIDLRTSLLPNEHVLGLTLCAGLFHLCTFFGFFSPKDMLLGAFMGGASLYLVKFLADGFYKRDVLGWGDIKLMAAAGFLLGPSYIWLAMALGAGAGVVHGLLIYIRHKGTVSLNSLSLPAGPGFITGIGIAALIAFHTLQDIL
ncbi:MAG: prepilin peptidase [Alphaproteobacteria bacterium]